MQKPQNSTPFSAAFTKRSQFSMLIESPLDSRNVESYNYSVIILRF